MSIYYPQGRGSWYDYNYKNQVQELLSNVPHFQTPCPPIGILTPHAGFVFSGHIAALSFSTVNWTNLSLVVILSTYHAQRNGLVLPNFSQIKYDNETLRVDVDLVHYLLSKDQTFRRDQGDEFLNEHAWENQLPFILGHEVSLLPILVGSNTLNELEYSGKSLISEIPQKNALFVITSDFTHYGPDYNYVVNVPDINQYLTMKDTEDIREVLNRDISKFHQGAFTVCGKQALLLWMLMLPYLGDISSYFLGYDRSVHYNRDSVSYASIIWTSC